MSHREVGDELGAVVVQNAVRNVDPVGLFLRDRVEGVREARDLMTVVSLNTGSCQGVTTSPTLIAMPSNAVIPVGGCTIVVIVTSSTPGTVTNVTSGLESGGITAPAASAPFSVATAPVDVTVDAPLALLLTAIAVGIGAAVHTGRARSASA